MRLKVLSSFKDKLNSQVEYIAKDNPFAARKFKSELISRIKEIPQMPYIHRKSIFFDRDDIRELIYKGYIIVYKVNDNDGVIEVFGLVKHEENPFI